MTQVLFFASLHLLGILIGFWAWPRVPVLFTAITGFLWGALCWVMLIMVYVIFGMHYTLITMVLPLLVLAAVLIWRIDWQNKQGVISIIGSTTLGLVIICSVLLHSNYTFLTNDSWDIITSSYKLPEGDTSRFVQGRAIFLMALHSASKLMGDGYLAPLSTIFLSIGLAVMFYVIWQGLHLNSVEKRTQITIPSVVLLYLLTSPAIRYQFSFIHDNMPVAAYMTAAIGSLWLGLCTKDKAWRKPAMAAFIAISLLRVEMPLFTILIIAIYISFAPMSYRERLTFAVVPSIPIIMYQIFVLTLTTDDSFVTIGNQTLMVGGFVGLNMGLAVSSYKPIEKYLLPNIWWLLILTLCVGLVIAFGTLPDHMTTSAKMMFSNLVSGGWGTLWIVLLLFGYFSLFLPSIPHEHFLVTFIVFSLMLTLLIVYVRETPYRLGYGDSANRMLLHVLFVFVFYLSIKFGHALTVEQFVIPLWQKVALAVVSITLVAGLVGQQWLNYG